MTEKFEFKGKIAQDPENGFEILLDYEQIEGRHWESLGVALKQYLDHSSIEAPAGISTSFPGTYRITVERIDGKD